jgi:NADH-quinone oxidoreductase subunit C
VTARRDLGERLCGLLGASARVEELDGEVTVDVPLEAWLAALVAARDVLGLTFFDWLSATDELDLGFGVVCHLVDPRTADRLLVRTAVPRDRPELPSATGVYRGADWHERETTDLFGVVFAGHPRPGPLVLPQGFAGHPLRKEFVLEARTARPWPGAVEPGGTTGRRRPRPLGVPPEAGP